MIFNDLKMAHYTWMCQSELQRAASDDIVELEVFSWTSQDHP